MSQAPLRLVDLAGLVGFLLLGLAWVWWAQPLARVLVLVGGVNRLSRRLGRQRRIERIIRGELLVVRVMVVVFGVWTAGGCSLCLLGVIHLRPEPVPGQPFTTAIGVAGMAGLLFLLAGEVASVYRVVRRPQPDGERPG